MRKIFIALAMMISITTWAEPFRLANVVIFVRFADQTDSDFQHDFDYYERMFNASEPGDNSVRNFYSAMSYGRLDWESVLIRKIYADTHSRGYFLPKTDSNPDGYTSLETMFGTRMKALVKDACKALEPELPEGVSIDRNANGEVDNVVMVICGNSAISASNILWPANERVTSCTLGGKNVGNFLRVFDAANGYKSLSPIPLNTGVLCHEMMHTLNAYDLYTSSSVKTEPVGIWDLMSDNQVKPQGFTAFTRMKYGKDYGVWLPENEVKTLSEAGEYRINPLSSESSEQVAYKIVPDASKQEYFMVEYRDHDDLWDSSLPRGGLLIYRVNPTLNGNLGSGTEVYIFRPGGTASAAGTLSKAPLGSSTGRFSFGAATDSDYPYYSDGTRAPFSITEVSETPGEISFRFDPKGMESSGIEAIEVSSERDVIYNLQGMRIDRISAPGIYIINGRKTHVR